MRILLVQGATAPSRVRAQTLEDTLTVVETVHDTASAEARLLARRHDAVLLDLDLPGHDVPAWVRRLRDRGETLPVLLLTTRADARERARGLDAGADDCLAPPFDADELQARLRAVQRRAAAGRAHPLQQVGRLVYDAASCSFSIGTRRVALPLREHQVLEALIARPGQTLSKRLLVERLCPLDHTLSTDALEIYVHRLRRKLAGSGAVIRTLRGLGYLLEAEG